jgi:hypothetical protein
VATVLANPNFPIGSFEVDFGSANGPPDTPTTARLSINAAYRRLAVREFSVDRGRQYELDQIQAGTLVANVFDPLELFNVANASSPFNTGGNIVTPYRPVWNWWMWPNQPGSGNIINTGVHTDYDPSFELNPDSALGLWVAAGGTTTLARSTVQHFDGTHALLITQSAAGAGFGAQNTFRTAPDLTYTFSCYVFLTAQTGLTVTARVVDANGAIHTSTSTSTQGSWVRLSVTWNTVDTLEPVTVYGTGVAAPTFYLDATMLEFGAAVSTFTTTGPTLYVLYSGWVERFPTTYDMSGFRATRPLAAVDALAILSRTAVSQSYTATITADAPVAYAPMSNSKPATSGGALSTGSETAKITGSNITGNPIYHPSDSGTINWGGDSQPDGTTSVVLQQNNPYNPPKVGHTVGTYPDEQQSVFDVIPAGITVANTAATIEMWVKFSQGVVLLMQLLSTAVHGGGLNTELGFFASNSQNHLELYTSGGKLLFHIVDAVAGYANLFDVANFTIPGAGFPDEQWHYYAITFYSASGSPGVALTYDAVETDVVAPTGVRNYGFTNLHHEATTDYGDTQSQASIARFAVYNRDIGAAARQAHFQRGVGWINEISGSRVARLLGLYWGGATSVAPGVMALAPDFEYDPGDGSQARVMLDILQEIQESERGLVYAAKDGTVVFEDRTSRYTAGQTALWVFGENPAGASPVEYPYLDYAEDVDPTYTFSQANLSRPANNNFAPIVNAATQAKYGQRILTQTVQCNTDEDLTQAGIFYTSRYATPLPRIAKLTLNPAANPVLWPVVLSLEISQRVTVKRRNAGLTVSRDYYIEKVSHKVNSDDGTWIVDLQLSPVFVTSAWVLADATYGVLGTTTTPVY